MLARFRRSIPLVLALAAFGLATAPSAGLAQNVFNPYGNSGYADYREYARPTASNDPSLPGQARLQGQSIGGRNLANQFESYTNSIGGREGDLSDGTRNGQPPSRAGVPYFRAYRQYDEQYKRVYRPNDTVANRQYEDRMKQRNAAYARALEERDPVKRARLLRQIEQDALNRPGSATPSTSRAPAPEAGRATANRAARAPAPPAARAPGSAAPTSASRAPARAVAPAPATVAPSASTAPAPAPASDPASVPIPPPR